MNQCSNCGELNSDKSKYCSNCGYELPKVSIFESKGTESQPVKKKQKLNVPVIFGVIFGILLVAGLKYVIFDKFGNSDSFKIDRSLMLTANELNKNCPIMVDSETRLDNVISLPGKIIQYNYCIINFVKSDIDTLQLKTALEPNITNLLKTNPQTKQLRDNDVIFNYLYKDKNNEYICQISVTPEEYK